MQVEVPPYYSIGAVLPVRFAGPGRGGKCSCLRGKVHTAHPVDDALPYGYDTNTEQGCNIALQHCFATLFSICNVAATRSLRNLSRIWSRAKSCLTVYKRETRDSPADGFVLGLRRRTTRGSSLAGRGVERVSLTSSASRLLVVRLAHPHVPIASAPTMCPDRAAARAPGRVGVRTLSPASRDPPPVRVVRLRPVCVESWRGLAARTRARTDLLTHFTDGIRRFTSMTPSLLTTQI